MHAHTVKRSKVNPKHTNKTKHSQSHRTKSGTDQPWLNLIIHRTENVG